MNNKVDLLSSLRETHIIAIMRNIQAEQIESIVEVLYSQGIRLIEYTMNSQNVEKGFSILMDLCVKYPDLIVGAGTVTDKSRAVKAKELGAKFFVTPNVNKEVLAFATEEEIPVACGAVTPSEILEAMDLGATTVKIFPAGTFGSDYIKEIRSALSEVPFLPTGSIELDEIKKYKELGVIGYGLGSKLLPKLMIENKDYTSLKENVKMYMDEIKK